MTDMELMRDRIEKAEALINLLGMQLNMLAFNEEDGFFLTPNTKKIGLNGQAAGVKKAREVLYDAMAGKYDHLTIRTLIDEYDFRKDKP